MRNMGNRCFTRQHQVIVPSASSQKRSRVENVKFWVAVVSKEHALNGIAQGFVQVCHGKDASLKRMKKDDWLLYYSPKEKFEGKEPCQKFVGIGKVSSGNVYQVEMLKGFKPHRLDIEFVQNAVKTAIAPLIEALGFIKNKQSWGMYFRYGHLQIPRDDFILIARSMNVHLNDENELTLEDSKKSTLQSPSASKRVKN